MLQKLMDQRAKARSEESGFTLIELLVVIIILGILAAVVVFAVSGINDKGQASSCKIDTRTLRTAEEAFFATPVVPGGQKVTPAGSYAPTTPPTPPTMGAQQLVDEGFISSVPKYHDVTLTRAATWSATPANPAYVPNAPYYVVVNDAGCGTVGHAVGEGAVGTTSADI